MYNERLILMYRIIYLVGFFLEPLLGLYLLNFQNHTCNDSISIRLITGLCAGIAGLITFNKPFFLKNFRSITLTMCIIFVSQRYYLLSLNKENWHYIIDLYTIIVLSVITFPTKKDLLIGSILITLPGLFFPFDEYAVLMNTITIIPLIAGLKINYFLNLETIINFQKEAKEKATLYGVKSMMSNLSHDVNNYLMQIGVIVGMNKLNKKINDEDYQIIKSKIKKISELFESINDFSITEKDVVLESHNIKNLIEKALSLSIGQLEQNYIKVNLLINEDIIFETDEKIVINILHQYIKNALDELKKINNPELTIKTEQIKDKIIIKVIDNAGAIKPDIKSKLFEPFVCSKQIGDGKGLGLSFCKELSHLIKGRVFLESDLPTTFSLEIKNQKRQ